jgi:hypothetical protein
MQTDPDALADRLRAWQPSNLGLDRDRLIYEAGRTAGRSEPRPNLVRLAMPLGFVASFLVGWSVRPSPGPAPMVADVAAPDWIPRSIEALGPVDPESYLGWMQRMTSVAPGQPIPIPPSTRRRAPSRPVGIDPFDQLENM